MEGDRIRPDGLGKVFLRLRVPKVVNLPGGVAYRRAFESVKADYPSAFPPNETISLKPRVLAYVVGQLQMYSLLESDVDVKGHAYEEIVGANLRGDRGVSVRTRGRMRSHERPREVLKRAAKILPRVGSRRAECAFRCERELFPFVLQQLLFGLY